MGNLFFVLFEIFKTSACILGIVICICFACIFISGTINLVISMKSCFIDVNDLKPRLDSLVDKHVESKGYMNCITDIRRIIDDLLKS